MDREQSSRIKADLKRKMVLLSGPRQVGKSWLSKEIMKDFARPRYLNWDNIEDREVIQRQGWSTATDLLVLDEIHKMPGWKPFASPATAWQADTSITGFFLSRLPKPPFSVKNGASPTMKKGVVSRNPGSPKATTSRGAGDDSIWMG
jgi:hypothetical protein